MTTTKRLDSVRASSPAEAWTRAALVDPDLIERADPKAIRASMTQVIERKLRRRRVQLDRRFYDVHPTGVGEGDVSPTLVEQRKRRIAATEGQWVDVRFLHGRVEYVSVYTKQGEYLGDGLWEKIQTVEHAAETAEVRRAAIRTMEAALEKIAVRDHAAIAARREEALRTLPPTAEEYDEAEDRPQRPRGRPATGSRSKKNRGKRRDGPTMREAAEAQRRTDIKDAARYTTAPQLNT